MIINLMWLLVIVAAAVSQWAIIEKKVRRPNKKLWFGIRAIVAAGFGVWYWLDGQYLVWAIPYLVMSFAWLFPLLLNWFRGKEIGYMSAEGSKFDAFIMRTISAGIYFWLGLVLFVMTTAMQLVYNWSEPTSFSTLFSV